MTYGPAWKEGEQAVAEYERLRANALGAANCPCGLAVLLRHGMAAWLDLACRAVPSETEGTGKVHVEGSGQVPGFVRAVAVVLADAVLAMAQHTEEVRA
jgi:hypothetical protein